MAESIKISIDLDSAKYVTDLKNIDIATKNLEKSSKSTFDKSIPSALNSSEKAVSSLSNSIDKVFSSIGKIVAIATSVGAALAFAEARFGLLTKAGNKLNINLAGILASSRELSDTFSSFILGEKSFNDLKIEAGLFLNRIGLLNSGLLSTVNFLKDFTGQNKELIAISASVASLAIGYKTIGQTVTNLGVAGAKLSSTIFNVKGIFSLTSALSTASAAFLILSDVSDNYNSVLAKTLSTITKVAAIITGGISAAITFTILKASELGQVLGNFLVSKFQQATNAFAETQNSTDVFIASVTAMNRTVGNVAGTFDEWEMTINSLSSSLNISANELRKSSQEIVLVGTQLGLTSDQMRNLLAISSEYAKINKKDVFDVTVAITGALNGNAQAVTALGIKLSEASVQQFAFSKGITQSFQSLSESEKVQLRYNKLLKQYSDVSGIASVAAGSFADQSKALAVNIERLNAGLGKGAAIIENNNIVNFALNKILNTVSDSTLQVVGFFGALGARLLQIGSIALEFSFKIFAVTKAITLLDILLSTNLGKSAFATSIPLINKSLNELLTTTAGYKVEVNSLKGFVNALGSVAKNNLLNIFTLLTGRTKETATIFNVFTGSLLRLKDAINVVLTVIKPFILPFAKFAIVGALVVGAVKIVVSAFLELEKRTKVFSELFKIVSNELSNSFSIFSPIAGFFSRISESIKELASKGFGLFVFGLSKVVEAVTSLAQKNPFNVFSQETISKISLLNGRLKGFSEELKLVSFDISKIPQEAERAISGTADRITVNLEELVQKLNGIRDAFKDFGLSDKEVIRKREEEALETIRLSYENKLLAEQEYQTLRAQIIQDANNKIKEIEKKDLNKRNETLNQANRIMNSSLANALSGGIQNIVKSLSTGQNVFKNFASFVVQTFGDLAIQLGQFYIAEGLAKLFLLKANPAAQITAGASLVALGSIMKSFFAGGLGGNSSSGGVASIGAQPAPGQFSTPQNDLAQPDSIERQLPSTNVSINVQGSLVQQEELGEFITRTLSESFGKQGITLTNARLA